jgi:peptide deformylase
LSPLILFGSEVKKEEEHSMKLKIMQMGEKVLRKQARELRKEEILSPKITNLIEMMKETMRDAPGVGLAAPQIGMSYQLAVIEDPEAYLQGLPPEKLAERMRSPVPFHVIINPKLFVTVGETADFFEGCLSCGTHMGAVERALRVRVECLNEKAEPIVIEAEGWYARILQHEIDHLFGTLFIDKVDLRTLMTVENYSKYWKSESTLDIKEALLSDCTFH